MDIRDSNIQLMMADFGSEDRFVFGCDEEDNFSMDGDDRKPGSVAADSDEDTEDASETDVMKLEEDYSEVREQMYKEKLESLKTQLKELQDETHTEYLKKLKKIEKSRKERLKIAEVFKELELENLQRDYVREKKAAVMDFDVKKINLKESLISELDEKKRHVEKERNTMELTGDPMEVKPAVTRKLRRRPNDPPPIVEKRRKASPVQLNFLLSEDDIINDLKIVNKNKFLQQTRRTNGTVNTGELITTYEAKYEDGKLYYDNKLFMRGQAVYVDSKEHGKTPGIITAIAQNDVWVKRLSDSSRMRVTMTQLQKGKYAIRRRTT